MESEIIKCVLPYVKYTCWTIIIVGIAYLAYRRSRTKLVTLSEITDWANENKSLGTNLFVSKLSVVPTEVCKTVHKELGMKIILNGYRDDTSVLATITDANQNVVKSFCFMGTKLDDELVLAMGETGLNIKL